MRTAIWKVWIEMPTQGEDESDEDFDVREGEWFDKVHAGFQAIPGFVEDDYIDYYE